MKYVKFAVFGVLLIALVMVVRFAAPVIMFIVMVPPDCNEGKDADRQSTNARGDVVANYIKVCSAVGTFVDYSIILQLHADEKPTKLVDHSDTQNDYPKFHWINDDMLMIDLGKVSWIRSPVHTLGSVKITYSYAMGE